MKKILLVISFNNQLTACGTLFYLEKKKSKDDFFFSK